VDVVERLTLEAAQADTMIACEHRHRYEFAAALVSGRRVLDLCCGSGYGAAILSAPAEEVTGVDNDVATVEMARITVGQRLPNVSFEAAEAIDFLHTDIAKRFDVVVCFEGLEHLDDLDGALALLQGHVERGVRLVASVPNDKLTGVRNPFHRTDFGYDEAKQAFARFPSARLVPQFLAEGSLIVPAGATEAEVEVSLEDRDEPEYANHFIFCVGFAPEEIARVHHGKIQLNTSPIFNRWSEELKQAAWALRRENARLARAALGKASSAAASALNSVAEREARNAALEERCRLAEARVVELEATLAAGNGRAPQSPPPAAWTSFDAVEARPLELGEDGNPNSWEQRRRRAAEVLLPWVEQTVPLAAKTVLEYGCGSAPVSCAVAERAGRVIGLDVDASAIEEGRRHLEERSLDNVELEAHPLEEILEATAARQGEVDVFLLYAVLEHMTVSERLTLLRLARDMVKPDGAIVVCETPNRLIYFDHHTAQMPFFHLLPDELALEVYRRSLRPEFVEAIDAALVGGRGAGLDAVARWGRGVSFHEFEAVFGDDLDRHVIGSSYDPLLFGERPVHPEDVLLSRYLARMRPDLAPAWSRYWLDVILSPRPVDRRPPFVRPWLADTIESSGVGWTQSESLLLTRPGARLAINLPQPTTRVIVGSATLDGRWLSLFLRPVGSGQTLRSEHRASAGAHAFTSFSLDAPAQRFTLEATDACYVVFVGYDA